MDFAYVVTREKVAEKKSFSLNVSHLSRPCYDFKTRRNMQRKTEIFQRH